MKNSNLTTKISTFLIGAGMLLSCNDEKPVQKEETLFPEDYISLLMSEDYKAVLFDRIIHGEIPENALAQPDNSINTNGVIDLDKEETVEVSALQELNEKFPEGRLRFTMNGETYGVKASDIVDLYKQYEGFVDKLAPGSQTIFIIQKNNRLDLSSATDKTKKVKVLSISSASFVYLNKAGMAAGIGHEAGHIYDKPNPKKDIDISLENEFNADRTGAQLTSIEDMEQTIFQLATADQTEARNMPSKSMHKYLNSPEVFGFTNIEDHPSSGRRVQYLEMLKLYNENKIEKPSPPPAQDFTPSFKTNNNPASKN